MRRKINRIGYQRGTELSTDVTRSTLFTIFFFAALLFLLSQLYAIFESFLAPIAWSIILALVFHPTYRHALRLTGQRRGLAAALITVAVFLLVAIPMGLLSGVLAREGAALIASATEFFESGGVARTTAWLSDSTPGHLIGRFAPQLTSLQLDLTSLVQTGVTSVGNALVGTMGGLAKNVATILIDLFIVLFTLFFLFRDGDRMYEALRALIPMEPGDKDAVLTRTQEMLEAVVRGMVITAALQGVLTGIGLVFAGVPYAAFLAEPPEYVLNQAIETLLARDREFVAWREAHPGPHTPRPTAAKGRPRRRYDVHANRPLTLMWEMWTRMPRRRQMVRISSSALKISTLSLRMWLA